MALGFLEWSARRGGPLLALGIFAGLFIPPLAALFRDVVTFSVATLMTGGGVFAPARAGGGADRLDDAGLPHPAVPGTARLWL
jgi:hypothetical protein